MISMRRRYCSTKLSRTEARFLRTGSALLRAGATAAERLVDEIDNGDHSPATVRMLSSIIDSYPPDALDTPFPEIASPASCGPICSPTTSGGRLV